MKMHRRWRVVGVAAGGDLGLEEGDIDSSSPGPEGPSGEVGGGEVGRATVEVEGGEAFGVCGAAPRGPGRLGQRHAAEAGDGEDVLEDGGEAVDPALPLNTAMPSCNNSDPCRSVPEVEFLMRHPLPDGAYWKKEGNWGDHKDVGPRVFEHWKGHFAGLFRHPARRALSAFSFFKGHPDLSKKQYAQQVAGTAVRMLAGQRYGLDCNACCNCAKSPPPPNTQLALERLRTGFAFVGMTDDYRMSVCLFHARFGGTCTRAEFANMRPTSKPSNDHSENETAADWTRQVEGFVDHDDLALYQAAHARFCNDLKTYQVTQATCRNVICPAAADLFDDAPTGGMGCRD